MKTQNNRQRCPAGRAALADDRRLRACCDKSSQAQVGRPPSARARHLVHVAPAHAKKTVPAELVAHPKNATCAPSSASIQLIAHRKLLKKAPI